MNATASITEIKINFAESNLEWGTFQSLLEANIFLARVAEENRGKMGYAKVDFTATFSDGEQYKGRFDVHGTDKEQETSNGALCFLRSMQDHVEFITGNRQPQHLTAEQYSQFIDRSENALEWFARLGCKVTK